MIPPQLFCDSREVTQLSCRTSLLVYTIISGTIRSLRNSKVSLSSLQLPNLDLIEGQSKSTRLRLNTLLTLCVKYKEVYSGNPSELHVHAQVVKQAVNSFLIVFYFGSYVVFLKIFVCLFIINYS